ncbi:iron-containing alcohol dehydrogenase [Clostridium sp.]|nr:iron-containing alcohol dehydrogenase [Clostridium sp.]MCI1714827.1 iron-containing alcohol dehydrogenase [Clostridium sp.]MCI1798984.1 iron-containing alcohol dehydrogenase [Clostridium sp.]MCI1813010.1 iron-containing alcohol dehydrogenase [Clostridium sp.]MCI1869900.1 iron-containing alcohol dehydrogenase [Clostridium sp.]MCI2202407.1 iron-containing alcohol dehydrogenase [Clostridium sp.]
MTDIKIPKFYVSGKNILDKTGKYTSKFGKYALIICGKTAWNKTGQRILMNLARERLEYRVEVYHGHCTLNDIKIYSESARKLKVDVVLGVGGGKVIDMAKTIGDRTGKPVIAIPTVATSCAACSNISIIYDDTGRYIDYVRLKKLPELILTDIDLILESSIRYLNAGIGYAMSVFKYFDHVKQDEYPVNILEKYIEGLYEELDENIDDECYRKLIDSIIVLSGMRQNHDIVDNSIDICNYVVNNMTYISDTRYSLYGEKTSFALVVQFVLENRSKDEIFKAIDIFTKIGLPVTLSQLGIKYGSKIKISGIKDNIHLKFRDYEKENIIEKAIIKADEMGNEYLGKKSSGNDQILNAII